MLVFALYLVLESIENHTLSYVLFFLLLATINWMLESMKWQELVCLIESISFLEALQQTLASLTISLPTPSRLGEYGAKAFFFQKNLRKKVVFLIRKRFSLWHSIFICFFIFIIRYGRNPLRRHFDILTPGLGQP